MGGGPSKQAVVIRQSDADQEQREATSALEAAQAQAQAAEERARTAAAYVDAEEALYREGYKKGAQDTLAQLDSELERQAHTAYAHASWADEQARAAALQAELDRLTASQYRAPLRPTECGDEERAVLACEPRTDARRCADVITAYDRCAQRVTAKLMYPLR